MKLASLFPDLRMRLAETPDEREALYRFRYAVYHGERGWDGPFMDHERQRMKDPLDDASIARQFYVGDIDDLAGTMRVLVCPPGALPDALRSEYALDRFEGIDELHIAEFGRFAIHPTRRAGLTFPTFALSVARRLAATEVVDLAFCVGRPYLVQHYRKLGYRPYGAPAFRGLSGLTVPLVMVPTDHAHLRSINPMLAYGIRAAFRDETRSTLDPARYAHLFEDDQQRLEDDKARVLAAVISELEALQSPESDGAAWLRDLPHRTLEVLARSGFLLKLDPGDVLIEEGMREREAYALLSGRCDVLVEGERLGEVTAGEIVGEVALFMEGHRRTATLQATTPARVLAFDTRILRKINAQDPDAGFQLFELMGRTLARRVDVATRRSLVTPRS